MFLLNFILWERINDVATFEIKPGRIKVEQLHCQEYWVSQLTSGDTGRETGEVESGGGEVEKKQQPIETRQLAVTPPATPAYTTADECHSFVLILSNRFSF